MVYAQIKNNIIVNTIILDDTSLTSVFAAGYDYFIQISTSPGSPAIGWSYNSTNNTFSAPSRPSPTFNDNTFSLSPAKIGISYIDNVNNYVNNPSLINNYAASNLPNWLVLDPDNGYLLGTPSILNVGTYNNIILTINDSITATVSIVVS